MIPMQRLTSIVALVVALPWLIVGSSVEVEDSKGHHHRHKHHHGHHHKHHHKHHRHHHAAHAASQDKAVTAEKPASAVKPATAVKAAIATQSTKERHDEKSIVEKMKKLEEKIAEKRKAQATAAETGSILVNGPLPVDFQEHFTHAVSLAEGVEASKVKVLGTTATKEDHNVIQVTFTAPQQIVKSVESDAADPDSKLAKGDMHSFLVAKDDKDEAAASDSAMAPAPAAGGEATPVEEKGIDIDTAMPYGDLEPFGREDTAQELTESSVKESDEMVDQLERAEVAEEKRAVFRALTRLRGAAITSFDGVARSQTGNIDEYNKIHQWRKTHPLHHLADEESDVAKWAFPDNADF